jgi:hypothetical protein
VRCLHEFAALAVGEAHAEGAGEAGDEGLAELVAVVAGAVGGLELDLERAGELGRVLPVLVLVLPRERVVRDVEVAHTVPRRAGHHQRPATLSVV